MWVVLDLVLMVGDVLIMMGRTLRVVVLALAASVALFASIEKVQPLWLYGGLAAWLVIESAIIAWLRMDGATWEDIWDES